MSDDDDDDDDEFRFNKASTLWGICIKMVYSQLSLY